jgi:hypothetical protein
MTHDHMNDSIRHDSIRRDAKTDDAHGRHAHRLLEDRVLGCLPVTGQAFGKLLGLLSIEASDRVPTAAVTTGIRSRLLINPDFVERHCRSDDHLAMLVLHELYHVLLGHTRLYPRVTLAQNWAFDCLINAQLCRLFPAPRYTSFFGQFAWSAGGPARLLGPPQGWLPTADGGAPQRGQFGAGRLEDSQRADADLLLDTVHQRLYSDDSITATELFQLLERVGAEALDGDEPMLLGSHSAGDGDESLHPELQRELRDFVARWPMIDRRSGRDQGGAMAEDHVTPGERCRQAVAVLRRTIAAAAGTTDDGVASRIGATSLAVRTPFDAGHDRRAWVQRLSGVEPLLFDGSIASRLPVGCEPIRVYLDVSGSMDRVLPPLYAALAACLDSVEPIVYGFSTDVAPLTHAQLRDGLKLTTGGTEVATVTEHLLRTGARRAVIVTDGWVGRIPDDHLAEIRRRRLRLAVAVTTPGDPGFASAASLSTYRLPELQ